MKSYDEIAESILRKYNSRLEEKKRRKAIIRRTAVSFAGAAAAVALVWLSGIVPMGRQPFDQPDIVVPSQTEAETIQGTVPAQETSQAVPNTRTAAETTKAVQNTRTAAETSQAVQNTRTAAETSQAAQNTRTAAETSQAERSTRTADETSQAAGGTSPAPAPQTTTQDTTANDERRIYMNRKFAAIALAAPLIMSVSSQTAEALPVNDPVLEYGFMYTQEQYIEFYDAIDNGIINLDINGNGTLDTDDMVMLEYYYDMRDRVSYKYTDEERAEAFAASYTPEELERLESSEAAIRGLENYDRWENSIHVSAKSVIYNTLYYFYRQNSFFPTEAQLHESLCSFCGGMLCGTIFEERLLDCAYWADYKTDSIRIRYGAVYDDTFKAIDDGEINADFNMDGNIDHYDIFEMLMYYSHVSAGGAPEDYYDPAIYNNLMADGDINGDGSVAADDADILMRYCYTYHVIPKMTPEEIEEALDKYASITPYDMSADSFAASTMFSAYYDDKTPGDVDLDNEVSAADASAILSYYSAVSTEQTVSTVTQKNMQYLGDLNRDGLIDTNDASMLLDIYAVNATS